LNIVKIVIMVILLNSIVSSDITKYAKEIKDGVHIEYYKNGMIIQETEYKNGRKNGLERKYSKNNCLDFEINYKDDKKHGSYKIYDEDGKLWADILFVDDKAVDGIAYTSSGKQRKIPKTIFHKLGFKY